MVCHDSLLVFWSGFTLTEAMNAGLQVSQFQLISNCSTNMEALLAQLAAILTVCSSCLTSTVLVTWLLSLWSSCSSLLILASCSAWVAPPFWSLRPGVMQAASHIGTRAHMLTGSLSFSIPEAVSFYQLQGLKC